MIVDAVYNNGGEMWCRIMVVKNDCFYGVTANFVDGKYWPWKCVVDSLKYDTFIREFKLVTDIPEDVRDKLFDPFLEIEFRKQAIRKGEDI